MHSTHGGKLRSDQSPGAPSGAGLIRGISNAGERSSDTIHEANESDESSEDAARIDRVASELFRGRHHLGRSGQDFAHRIFALGPHQRIVPDEESRYSADSVPVADQYIVLELQIDVR